MSKYTYMNHSRRHVDYTRVMAVILGISVIAAAGSMVRGYMITKNIKEVEVANQETQKVINEAQKTIEDLKEKNVDHTREVNNLKELLWRYEPVVIPDSMK